jgi:hypothetical protein
MATDQTNPPAGAFLANGYVRDDAVTAELLEVVGDALRAYPNQRFGQLLTNAGIEGDTWNLHDETVINRLRDHVAGARRDRA